MKAHGTDQQWTRDAAIIKTADTSQKKDVACPNCGYENPGFAEICARCGKDLDKKEWDYQNKVPSPAYGEYQPIRMIRMADHIPDDTPLDDDVTAQELRQYVKVNTQYYLPRFLKFSKGKSCVSWNWSAFLLAPCWLWSRKQYVSGSLVLLFQLLQTVVTAFFSYQFLGLSSNFTMEDMQNSFMMYSENSLFSKWMLILYLFAFVSFLLDLFYGLFGNYFYYHHSLRQIRKLKDNGQQEQILQKGGFSLFLGSAIYMIMYLSSWVVSLLFMN
jgi:DNA-directed RNA polymerase subunit RPC12/RpoP